MINQLGLSWLSVFYDMANAFPSVKKHVLDLVVDRVTTGLSATLLKQRHCNALLVLES